MKLLIVDDHAPNLKLLRVRLEAEGHTVAEAGDGVEALHILARESVDAVISDVLMPNMDGFRLCLEIRKTERLRGLPFIIYTSTYNSPEDMKLAETVGADKYLTKPAPLGAILGALGEAMKSRIAPRAEPAPVAEESLVLKQYSQALINKLEHKNAELQQAMADLQKAHEQIVELNSDLERRVTERTLELQIANGELTVALSNVKELSGLLPICSYCRRIRDDQNYWRTVEDYLRQHTDAKFSHGICPECVETHIKPQIEAMKQEKSRRESQRAHEDSGR